jgi:hypothetical protein
MLVVACARSIVEVVASSLSVCVLRVVSPHRFRVVTICTFDDIRVRGGPM